MEQIITPEMIGWKPLTDISDIKHDDFFPFIAFREKISDNWTVKHYIGSTYWDRVKQKAIDYNDFKVNWSEVFYYFPEKTMFWLDSCTEREVSLVCQTYAEIFNREIKENKNDG